ncbi:MAG: carbohydrate ABC transporter permease, partial [Candidatus Promineifilaceae bacterium]|nr:carbohydrate ABC transporter permease [Candidatus Promineifilaceae bacterium]
GYGIVTSLKTDQQMAQPDAPIIPSSPATFTYEGEEYDIYSVPTDDGMEDWALVNRGREASEFVDPDNPDAGLIEWEGRWRTLERSWETDIQWSNYPEAWDTIDFLLLLRNTVVYAILSTIGAVASSALVAYGFARFEFRGKRLLFAIVMATIILPGAVTLIPTYAFFNYIGWVGTWKPLIVPVYFANAYNIFLLRQFFMTLPRDLDEAATIDGASPFRVFWSVILPNARPALTAVVLFHFFFAWNDFFGPLIYLAGNPDQFPITVGLTGFSNLYETQANLVQAASLIASVIPLIIFFFAQRIFLEGIQIGGVGIDK